MRALLLFCFLSVLWYAAMPLQDCSGPESAGLIETENEETTETGVLQNEYEENTEMVELESGMDTMFLRGTRQFYCGYPVDEAFLCWVAANYGNETIVGLADALSTGNTDPELWYQRTGNSMHVLWMNYCLQTGFEIYRYENVVWKEAADASCIKLDFVGDINFDGTWHTMEAAGGREGVSSCISEGVQKELQSADVTIVNNEFVYTKRGEAQEGKTYCFRTDPQDVQLLELFGTDLVSVANNHVYDYGEQGFLDTLDTLQNAGIAYCGGGRNVSEAAAAKYFIVGGRKIAVVSATEIERFSHFTKSAGTDTPGVLKTQQTEELKKAIQNAGKNSDYVIAFLHWGAEGKIHYDSEQKKLATLCVKAGADAVIGGHPHRLQGVEFIEDVPVAYSLGNFWFSTGSLYTAIAQIQIDENGELTLQMIPCVHKDVKTYLCEEEAEKKEFYHYLADVSSNVGMDENGRFYPYKDVTEPGQSSYAYTSGRRYGWHYDDVDLDLNKIDIVGNLQ